MHDESLVDHIVEALGQLTPDLIEPVIDALGEITTELGHLDHDDIVKLVSAVVTGAAGAATRHLLHTRPGELDAAIRRALAAG